jgi:hypothetical protein
MTPSNVWTRRLTTLALCLSMTLSATWSSAQERVNVDAAVIRQCHQDAIRADQYDDLRESCERLREEIWGLRAMHTQAIEERNALRIRVGELEGRWSPVTWYLLGIATAVAMGIGVLVAQ